MDQIHQGRYNASKQDLMEVHMSSPTDLEAQKAASQHGWR